MSLSQINDYGIGDVNLTSLMETLDRQRRGYQAVSLTNYDNTSEPKIAAGSIVELGGALFKCEADESITGWAGIGNNNDVYIKLVPSGTAATAAFTTAAPTWSTSKQGWYVGNHRYIFKLYKDGSGNYTRKRLLLPEPQEQIGTIEADKLFLSFTPADGTIQAYASDIERTTESQTHIKIKEICMPFTGTVNVYFELKTGNFNYSASGRIYINQAAVGIDRITTSESYVSFDEAIAVNVGDLLQLYIKIQSVTTAYVRYFRIRCDKAISGSILSILPVINQN